jgi:3-hydroxymyristoyl/3-hydroxydecanoyl-(acyl carrier protein) dehydratase
LRQQIRSMLRVEAVEGGFRAAMVVDPALLVLPDHFRGHPILPGMCMIQAVLLAAADTLGLPDLQLALLKNAKFQQPIVPGDHVEIDAKVVPAGGDWAIRATLAVGGKTCAEISLVARLQQE